MSPLAGIQLLVPASIKTRSGDKAKRLVRVLMARLHCGNRRGVSAGDVRDVYIATLSLSP